MTDRPADYHPVGRARARSATLDRIADAIGSGAMGELPDVFLIIIDRALSRDLTGICEFARRPGNSRFQTPMEATSG